jgi:hypothetical protein
MTVQFEHISNLLSLSQLETLLTRLEELCALEGDKAEEENYKERELLGLDD